MILPAFERAKVSAAIVRSVLADVLGLQTLEALDRDVLHESEHLVLGVLVLVALAGHADAHATRHVAHAVAPKELVQLSVNAHIWCAHHFFSELSHSSNRTRSALLELSHSHILVHVNREIPGGGLLGLPLAAGGLGHVYVGCVNVAK